MLGRMFSRRALAVLFALALCVPSPLTAGAQSTDDTRVQGAVDLPAGARLTRGDALTIRGWVGSLDDASAITDVSIFDGDASAPHLLGMASLSLERPDVVAALNAPSLARSGFSAQLDSLALGTGHHTLVAVANTRTGNTWTRAVDVDVVPPAPRPVGQFIYGTHITAIDHAQLARSDGFNLMWGYVPWQQVEPTRGDFLFRSQDRWGQPTPNALTNVINAAANANMKLILRIDEVPGWAGGSPAKLDPADLEAYLYQAVSYGRGTIQYVEVFNEPNLPYEFGGQPDPARYASLLAAASRGVKRADPNVQVISAAVAQRTGGLGGSMEDVAFLDGMYAAGAASSFDLLGMHAYLGNFAPETDPRSCTPMCFRDVERFRAVMDSHGDTGKQAFITEMGALEKTTLDLGQYEWMELAPDARADYLVRALQMANANYSWIRGAMLFNFDYATVPWNPQSQEKFWFSLLDQSGNERPALAAIKKARTTGVLT